MEDLSKPFSQNIIWRSLYYLLNFILTIFIARYFGSVMSGHLFYLMNNGALVILILGCCLESAIVFFSAENNIAASRIFHLSVVWMLVISIFLFLFSYTIGDYNNDFLETFRQKDSLLYIIGTVMLTYMSSFFHARKDFITPNLVSLIINVILIVVLSLSAKAGFLSGETFISIYFVSFLLQGLVMLLFLLKQNKDFRIFQLPNSVEMSRIFSFLSLVIITNVLSFLCYRADYWFVRFFCSDNELGNYIQVSKLVQLFFIFPGILATVIFPITSAGQGDKISTIMPMLTRIIFLVYSFLCLLLVIIGAWLFPFVFGKSFSLMYNCFLFYIPGIIGFSGLYLYTSFYAGSNRVMINVKGCLLALSVMLAGDWFFIPIYGITAAAAMSSCAYLVYFIFVVRIFMKEFNVSLTTMLLIKKEDLTFITNKLIQSTKR